jgi:methionyl-tRNA formyltransferase
VITAPLNIIFAGTPVFAAAALQVLIDSPHNVKAVYTQPDRPAGRGRHLTPSAVKQLALSHQIPVYQPLSLRDPEEQQQLKALQADIMVVVAYGLILPTPILSAPRLGCINIHASLLPRWRGAAPIQRAILAGDAKTGITIMQMDEGLDTGPMLHTTECVIQNNDTSESLHNRLQVMGAEALLIALENLAVGKAHACQQDNALATYAHKITKEEAQLVWTLPAAILEQQVRGFNPWPIAFTLNNQETLRVWQAEAKENMDTSALPGTIVKATSAGIDVATGEGVLRLLTVQLPGGRVLPVADILNARQEDFMVGKILGSIS